MESWNELSFIDQKSAVNSMLNGLERMALLLAETKQHTSDYIRAHHNICEFCLLFVRKCI